MLADGQKDHRHPYGFEVVFFWFFLLFCFVLFSGPLALEERYYTSIVDYTERSTQVWRAGL